MDYKHSVISQKKFNKWKEGRICYSVELDKIVITEQIHLDTKALHYNGEIMQLAKVDGKYSPLILRRLSDERYELLFGLKQLVTGKLKNFEYLPSIVVECDRDALTNFINNEYGKEKNKLMSIKDIKINSSFGCSIPNYKKVIKKTNEILEGIVEPVEVDKDNFIVDGYITYLILKELGHEIIMTKRKIDIK